MTDIINNHEMANGNNLSIKYRLKRFRVTNFRSIVDSGYVDIKN